jgi:hypothetical protein
MSINVRLPGHSFTIMVDSGEVFYRGSLAFSLVNSEFRKEEPTKEFKVLYTGLESTTLWSKDDQVCSICAIGTY